MNSSYKVLKWAEIYPPNPAMLRHMLVSEGYRVYQWSDEPETFYADHFHNDDQSHWVISGSLELTVERVGTFILEAGDRDFMPAGTYHSVRVIGEEPVTYLIGEKFG